MVEGLRKIHIKKNENDDDHRRFFAETEPIKVKSIDEIVKEAKASFHLARDRLKTEEESKKYGILRPICTTLLAEVKEEILERMNNKKKRKNGANRSPDVEGTAEEKPDFVVGRISRPKSSQLVARRRTTNTGMDGNESLFNRPSSARLSVRRPTGWVQPESQDQNDEGDRRSSVAVLHRSNSVGFNPKSVLDDERIMKAIRSKEIQAQEKEEQLKRKILEREQSQRSKIELAALQERQRAWMVLQASLCYLK